MLTKATIRHIKDIHILLQVYGDKGELLPRPLTQLYDHVRDFYVYIDQTSQKVIGCCGLQFCWEDMAEIRSLAVHPDHRGKNIGTMLVNKALEEAYSFKIKNLFTLTYRPKFFERFGFSIVDKSELPLKIWSDCIFCIKFPDCDEIAMIKRLDYDS